MDEKTWPTHILPTIDPPRNKRPTQTENEGLEKKICQANEQEKKKAGVATLILHKVDFKAKAIKETQKDTL